MKIAAALGVWPFWGWKIINHGGWFTQVKGRSWQKKRSSLYRSCLHERVILPDYRITSLLQFIHHFYNTFTTLLRPVHHLYNTFASLLHHLYITFTSFLQLIRHFYVSSILCAIWGQFGYRELLYGKPVFWTDLPIAIGCTPALYGIFRGLTLIG